MITAIRGAITVESNTENAIETATTELLKTMLSENKISEQEISYAIYTMTKDLNVAYPAKYARENLNFKNIPMMCYQELDIQNSLKMVLRVMLVVNKTCTPKHIYLKGAKVLRPDIA